MFFFPKLITTTLAFVAAGALLETGLEYFGFFDAALFFEEDFPPLFGPDEGPPQLDDTDLFAGTFMSNKLVKDALLQKEAMLHGPTAYGAVLGTLGRDVTRCQPNWTHAFPKTLRRSLQGQHAAVGLIFTSTTPNEALVGLFTDFDCEGARNIGDATNHSVRIESGISILTNINGLNGAATGAAGAGTSWWDQVQTPQGHTILRSVYDHYMVNSAVVQVDFENLDTIDMLIFYYVYRAGGIDHVPGNQELQRAYTQGSIDNLMATPGMKCMRLKAFIQGQSNERLQNQGSIVARLNSRKTPLHKRSQVQHEIERLPLQRIPMDERSPNETPNTAGPFVMRHAYEHLAIWAFKVAVGTQQINTIIATGELRARARMSWDTFWYGRQRMDLETADPDDAAAEFATILGAV